jgi:putative transposase
LTLPFTSAGVVGPLASILLHTAGERSFAVLAYCFMPDHVHVVVEGAAEDAAFVPFMKVFCQRTALVHAERAAQRLWQPGYHDRVLRAVEQTEVVVRYVLENPVRAGSCERAEDYPFSYWRG